MSFLSIWIWRSVYVAFHEYSALCFVCRTGTFTIAKLHIQWYSIDTYVFPCRGDESHREFFLSLLQMERVECLVLKSK